MLPTISVQLSAQWLVLEPNSKVFISQGIVKSTDKLTGTLGIHFFFKEWFGVSIQTNFINDFGWYQDFAVSKDDFKLCMSLGYSAVYNSFSSSLRICYRLKEFWR